MWPWQLPIELVEFVTTQTGGNTKFNLQSQQELPVNLDEGV